MPIEEVAFGIDVVVNKGVEAVGVGGASSQGCRPNWADALGVMLAAPGV